MPVKTYAEYRKSITTIYIVQINDTRSYILYYDFSKPLGHSEGRESPYDYIPLNNTFLFDRAILCGG